MNTTNQMRDDLAARLAEIEAQEPVAWVPIHPRTGPLWSMATGSPDPERLPHYPLMPLYTRPAPRNLAVDPLPTIRTGRYSHYQGGEYRVLGVEHQGRRAPRFALLDDGPARPCRTCGPEGCNDSTSCPREGGAA